MFAILVACSATGIYYSFGDDAATTKAPVFNHDQHLIVQIVTVSPWNVTGGKRYDEEATVIHTSHELAIPASGQGMSIQSVVDGIPINLAFSNAERGKEAASVVLHDLEFFLPLEFRTSANSSLMKQAFFGAHTEISGDFRDFKRRLSIHYAGENLGHTFIRMRIATGNKTLRVIDLTPTEPVSNE